jgi:hypothetical protein
MLQHSKFPCLTLHCLIPCTSLIMAVVYCLSLLTSILVLQWQRSMGHYWWMPVPTAVSSLAHVRYPKNICWLNKQGNAKISKNQSWKRP